MNTAKNSNPSSTNKPDKKLSIYLSTERMALLSGHANAKSLTLAQSLYALIDALSEPTANLAAVQADIRQLQRVVQDSITGTERLTTTLAQALHQEHESAPGTTVFDVWLQEALAGSQANTLGALIVPSLATGSGVRFATRMLKVADQTCQVPLTELVLSREVVGPVIWQLAQSPDTSVHLALTGRRVEGSNWLFRIVRKDTNGNPPVDLATFKHPS